MVRRFIGLGVIAVTVLAGAAVGCSGCEERLLDSAELWLRDDPERPGKVGTLVGLEVGSTARDAASQMARQGEGACEIGWRLDEPFSLHFEATIEVTRQGWKRRWEEVGTWRQDEHGRSMIDVDVEYGEGENIDGRRQIRAFFDEQGFWEWLGPDVVARYDRGVGVGHRWREEYSGRFAGLVKMSSGLKAESRSCGPGMAPHVDSWRPILMAHADEESITLQSVADEIDGREASCRELRGTYALDRGGEMIVEMRECLGPPPQELRRPEVARVVEIERDRSRSEIIELLQSWVDANLVESVEEPLEE
jgi:hypothetical protein